MNKNKKLNKEQLKSGDKIRLFLNDKMTIDKDFDIIKFLPTTQKKVKLKKLNLNGNGILPLIQGNSSNSYKSDKSIFHSVNKITEISNKNKIEKIFLDEASTDRKSASKINNILPLSNESIKVHLSENISNFPDKKKTLIIKDSTKNSKIQLDDINKNNKTVAKSTKSIFPKNSLFLTDVERKNKNNINQYQINKSLKKIKTNLENNLDTNIGINFNSENFPIAFSKRYENTVFNHLRQIHDFKYQKYLQLNPSKDCNYDFITENKLLTKNNILLKLMKTEQNKLQTNYNLHSDRILNNQKKLEKDQKEFEELKEKQKNIGKKFEYMHADIYQKNRDLINNEIENHYIIKNNQDEIRRILHSIDKLRVYALFINEVLGGDITRFENRIIPQDKFEEEIDYPRVLDDFLKKYNYFLKNTPFDFGNIKYNEELMKQEKTFIDEPEKMWFKYKEIENIIVRNVFTKENIKNEIKHMIEEKNNNLKDMKQRKEILEREYANLKESYEYEKLKYNEVEKRYIYNKVEVDEMINDLYSYSCKAFNNPNLKSKNPELYDTLDITKEIYGIIHNSEIVIDELVLNLNKFQKEDTRLFEKITENRKKYLKSLKSQSILEQKMKEKFSFIYDTNSSNRIVFKSRKTEAPYHKPKKVEKVEIDKSLIERLENEEMLTYEKEDDDE